MSVEQTFTVFVGPCRLAHGDIHAVAAAVAEAYADGSAIIFEDASGRAIDLDLREGPAAAAAEYLRRRSPPDDTPPRRPARGRPRLGVVAREVTLLPRHWDWLASQPGGASAALRRLVEEARRVSAPADRARQAQEALYRVMSALAGDSPGFEEASRALFAHDDQQFDRIVEAWPADVSEYLATLAGKARTARGEA